MFKKVQGNKLSIPALIVLFAAGLSVIFNYLFYATGIGLNIFVFVAILLVGYAVLRIHSKKNLSYVVLAMMVPLLFFAIMAMVRASYILTFFNIVAILYLLLLIADSDNWATSKKSLTSFIWTAVATPFLFIIKSSKLVRALHAKTEDAQRANKSNQVIKGVLMSLPVLFIFILLFSSADLVVRSMFDNLLDITISTEFLGRALLVIVMAIIFGGALYHALTSHAHPHLSFNKRSSEASGVLQINVFLGLVSLLFLFFIIIQGAYLFGGEDRIVELGITYAEYARKGFFELLAVALITLGLVWMSERSILKNNNTHTRSFKLVISILTLEVLLILTSAFQRLLMYEHAFGFTSARFYAHAILLFIGVVFLLFIVKAIIFERHRKLMMIGVHIALVLFLVAVNIINPDQFIAQHNIARALDTSDTTQELDYYYFSDLSADAIPDMLWLAEQRDFFKDEESYLAYSSFLYREYGDRFGRWEKEKDWRVYHLSRNRALRLFREKKELIIGAAETYQQLMKERVENDLIRFDATQLEPIPVPPGATVISNSPYPNY